MTYLRRLKHQLWMGMGCYPAFLGIFRLYGNWKGGIGVINSSTDIVIEGYPRSANTFALVAFSLVQQQKIEVAHHVHGPSQVIWAARRGIPTLVLIREPSDSVLSLIIRQPAISAHQALRNYIRFYERVLPYSNSYVLGDFEEVTRNYGCVIGRLNSLFGTDFARFEHTDENLKRCYRLIKEMDRRDTGNEAVNVSTVALPSHDRRLLRDSLRDNLNKDGLQALLAHAESTYEEMLRS